MSHREIILNQKSIIRFQKFIEKTESDCWLYTGFKNNQGYGRFGISAGQCVNAHRVAWTIVNGPIPINHFVCHTCDNPSCVNPSHLFVGTRQDNINDMMNKKRSRHFQKNSYYGVVWEDRKNNGHTKKGRWRSVIYTNGKMKKIGAHTSILEAARNYDRIAYMKYGIKDRLNFPEEYNLK